MKLSFVALSDNDISSHLNDEDDVFFSLDFNFIDSLQTKPGVFSRRPTFFFCLVRLRLLLLYDLF